MSNDINLSKEEIISKLSQLPSIKQAQQYLLENAEEHPHSKHNLFRSPNESVRIDHSNPNNPLVLNSSGKEKEKEKEKEREKEQEREKGKEEEENEEQQQYNQPTQYQRPHNDNNDANNNNNNNNDDNNDDEEEEDSNNYEECMYEHCKHRNKGEAILSNSRCRNCGIVLCDHCRLELKVLQCAYCQENFICSRHCYTQLINKDKNYKLRNLMPHLQFQSLSYQLQILADHVYSEDEYIDQLCFRNCAICGIHNCGCQSWICCRDCQKFYCPNCSPNIQKCKLKECECYTCCFKQQWDRNCYHCNLKKSENSQKNSSDESCGLLFCTRGHCTNHIISTFPTPINHSIKHEPIAED